MLSCEFRAALTDAALRISGLGGCTQSALARHYREIALVEFGAALRGGLRHAGCEWWRMVANSRDMHSDSVEDLS